MREDRKDIRVLGHQDSKNQETAGGEKIYCQYSFSSYNRVFPDNTKDE
jgi:hypothetical protein